MYDFIHVLIFVTVSKCRKSLKLTNIVIQAFIQIIDSFDRCSGSTSLSNCQVAVLKLMRYEGGNAIIQTRIHDKLKNALQPHWTSVSDLQCEVAHDLDLERACHDPSGWKIQSIKVPCKRCLFGANRVDALKLKGQVEVDLSEQVWERGSPAMRRKASFFKLSIFKFSRVGMATISG